MRELSEKVRLVLPDLLHHLDYIPTQILSSILEIVSGFAAEVSDLEWDGVKVLQYEEARITLR